MGTATLTPVKSSAFTHIGYDKDTETLTVKFTHGGTHEFYEVPEEKYDALMASESKGKHFHAEIRSKHRFQKLS
jgi:hypothetical protein